MSVAGSHLFLSLASHHRIYIRVNVLLAVYFCLVIVSTESQLVAPYKQNRTDTHIHHLCSFYSRSCSAHCNGYSCCITHQHTQTNWHFALRENQNKIYIVAKYVHLTICKMFMRLIAYRISKPIACVVYARRYRVHVPCSSGRATFNLLASPIFVICAPIAINFVSHLDAINSRSRPKFKAKCNCTSLSMHFLLSTSDE